MNQHKCYTLYNVTTQYMYSSNIMYTHMYTDCDRVHNSYLE